ncbi:MAG TPA: cysteine desulfurase-like protein [Kofleriaceae bacterium]|nr:cysteine desulfurase-like protein [Kofleriaceae bacterium]
MDDDLDVAAVREQFPALARRQGDEPVVHLDGAAGSQVPSRVIDAVAGYMASHNANTEGAFATSRETDAMLAGGRAAMADFLAAPDPDSVVFGASATALLLALGRSMARTWRAGDEIVVTQLDHDANVTPWVLAARDAGVAVRRVRLRASDTAIDLDDLAAVLNDRTRLVAFTAASNATGTMPPVAHIAGLARAAGAQVLVDAVHCAPHRAIDVAAWGCDYTVCSAYKFFGPHVGILWGRRDLLEALPLYQVRPAGQRLPGSWMFGTLNHEGIAGVTAAVDYLASLGAGGTRREALERAFARIARHEQRMCRRLLAGLADLADVRVWGIADPDRAGERAPTVSFTHARRSPAQVATYLAEHGVFAWHGNYFALEVSQALGREPDGMVRVSLLHYNTDGEVDRLLGLLGSL